MKALQKIARETYTDNPKNIKTKPGIQQRDTSNSSSEMLSTAEPDGGSNQEQPKFEAVGDQPDDSGSSKSDEKDFTKFIALDSKEHSDIVGQFLNNQPQKPDVQPTQQNTTEIQSDVRYP